MIKFSLILFDASGVIYDRVEDYDEEFFNELDAVSGFHNSKGVFKLLVYDCKMGRVSRKELFHKFAKIIGVDRAEYYLKEWERIKSSGLFLKDGVKEMLKMLSSYDVELGMLSDGAFSSSEKRDWLSSLGVARFFTHFFTSQSLGYTKIYEMNMREVLDEAGCEPREVLMVGHEYSDFIGSFLTGVKTLSESGQGLSTDYVITDLKDLPRFIESKGLITGR